MVSVVDYGPRGLERGLLFETWPGCRLSAIISHEQSIKPILMKSLDPLRAKKILIRKKLGHTTVSAIKASSVTL